MSLYDVTKLYGIFVNCVSAMNKGYVQSRKCNQSPNVYTKELGDKDKEIL